jgi:hypothetical protein
LEPAILSLIPIKLFPPRKIYLRGPNLNGSTLWIGKNAKCCVFLLLVIGHRVKTFFPVYLVNSFFQLNEIVGVDQHFIVGSSVAEQIVKGQPESVI